MIFLGMLIGCVLSLFQFEYQQASLEAEIENLSWKIERAESTDRGDLENQMDVAEKRRLTLLKDFLSV
jgi:ariadne-2